MVYVIGNSFYKKVMDIDSKVPEEVNDCINQTLDIYESNYSCACIPFQSGGYCILITNDSGLEVYEQILNQYGVTRELAEFSEVIVEKEEAIWYQEYFQLSTEYGITIFFYVPSKGDKVNEIKNN